MTRHPDGFESGLKMIAHWQGLEEGVERATAEAERWRKDAERLAGSLRYLLDDAWIVAWEGPTGRYYKRSVTGQRDIREAQAALAAHDATEEQP